MENKFHIEVSARAAQMFTAHLAYWAQYGAGPADKLRDAFLKALQSLEWMPERCPWLKDNYIPYHKYRFLLFEKRYMIIFQLDGQIVYVDYVLDCRQDYRWLIR